MSLRLFLIPWLWISTSKAQNPIPNNNGYMGPSFYELIQRQNQFNNALLLNNQLLTNSMNANIRDTQLQHALAFHPSLTPQLSPAHFQQLLTHHHNLQLVPSTGTEDRLGIYDNLATLPRQPQPAMLPVDQERVTNKPPLEGVVQFVPETTKESEGATTPIYSTAQVNKKRTHAKVTDHEGATIHIKTVAKPETDATTTLPPSTPTAPVSDVFNLLRQLNLTEKETDNLVKHVEQVVREELAKKLIETKLSSITLSPLRVPTTITEAPVVTTATTPATTSATTAATTVTTTEATTQTPVPATEASPTTMLVLEGGGAREEPEIKHHPPKRNHDKDQSYQSISIKTSSKHIPIVERPIDEESSEVDRESDRLDKEAEADDIDVLVSFKEDENRGIAAELVTLPPEDEEQPKEKDLKKVKPIPRYPYPENDADLLNMATGPPLDLSGEEAKAADVVYRNRSIIKTTPAPMPRFQKSNIQSMPRIRAVHEPTAFESLATDYRERLSGTGDINKIMRSFYENAFIQLTSSDAVPRKKPSYG